MRTATARRAPIESLERRQLLAAEYTVTSVPAFKDGIYTGVPSDISDDGRVIVGTIYNTSVFTAYKWTAATDNVVIGANLSSVSISGDGSTLLAFDTVAKRAVRIDSAGNRTTIGPLSGDNITTPAGISYDGKTIVGTSSSGNNDFLGFKWTAATGTQALPMPADAVRVTIDGVSRDGNTVFGSMQDAAVQGAALRWQGSGAAARYSIVSGRLGSAYVEDISDDGNAAAGWGSATATPYNEGVRWTGTATATPLGNLSGKGNGRALGISPDGQTVVGWSQGGGAYSGYRWTPSGGLVELDTLIPSGSGHVNQALAIAASGHILAVGYNASNVYQTEILAPQFARVTDGLLDVDGTDGNDVILFSVSGSTVTVKRGGDAASFALADFDRIEVQAGLGDDRVDMGAVNVRAYLSGGSGDDTLVGSEANDTLLGGGGSDRLYGRGGKDRVAGSGGRDFCYGEAGDDRVYGDAGNDLCDGGGNRDRVFGGDGDDYIVGGSSVDRLYGDAGNDQFVGGPGNDYLFGGDGTDEDLVFDAGDIVDSIEVRSA